MHDYARLLYSDKGISNDKDSTVNYFKLFDEENSDAMIYHAFTTVMKWRISIQIFQNFSQ